MSHAPDMSVFNAMPAAAFAALLDGLFEHSPWVSEGIAAQRPFRDAGALHAAMMARVREADRPTQLALIAAHPELAGREAEDGVLTADSTGEQGRLGFDRLSREEHAELARINAAYRARFGFPCIVALCRHATRESAVAAMRARLAAEPEAEVATAIEEIGHITAARLAARLG